jgi:hypothetical protein
MFAAKHSSGQIDLAAERAFAVMLALIEQGQEAGAIETGPPERVGLVLFATLQGIAALVAAGIVSAELLDDLVADAIANFLRGSRAAVQGAHPEARAARRAA